MLVFAAPLSLTLTLIFFNYWRGQLRPVELIPNCLITTHQITFLHGRPSLFYFFRYWNQLPHFLREHGYVVNEIRYRKNSLRHQNYLNYLEELKKNGQRAHLIVDSSLIRDLLWLLDIHHSAIESITLVKAHSDQNQEIQSNIHVLQLPPLPGQKALLAKFYTLLLWGHKFYTGQLHHLSGQALAIPTIYKDQLAKKLLLEHTIYLAESDLRCSH